MASIYEGIISSSTALNYSDRVWLSWTTRSNKLNRLPSTELLTDAIKKAMDLELECQLVNCVHADTGSLAIEKLKGLKNRLEKALAYAHIHEGNLRAGDVPMIFSVRKVKL